MKVVKGHHETPQRTFFFERPDGTTIASQEREAWAMMKHPIQIAGVGTVKFKFLGSSDGRLYYQAVADARKLFDEQGFFDDKCRDILLKGELDELAVARGNMVYPRNFDTIGQQGIPVNLANLR